MTSKTSLAMLTVFAAVTAVGAIAQPRTERAAIVQRLADCKKVSEDAARLRCYDQAAEAFAQAEAKGDVVIVDREQARAVRRQAFGFSLPSIALFEKGEGKAEVENFDGVVAAARQNNLGRWVVRLEDGAVWTQVDVQEVFKAPKPGMKVRIKKASLGSYLMVVDKQRAFRARRVE